MNTKLNFEQQVNQQLEHFQEYAFFPSTPDRHGKSSPLQFRDLFDVTDPVLINVPSTTFRYINDVPVVFVMQESLDDLFAQPQFAGIKPKSVMTRDKFTAVWGAGATELVNDKQKEFADKLVNGSFEHEDSTDGNPIYVPGIIHAAFLYDFVSEYDDVVENWERTIPVHHKIDLINEMLEQNHYKFRITGLVDPDENQDQWGHWYAKVID